MTNQSTSDYVTITLPTTPPANCEFAFEPSPFGFHIEFNGQYALLPGYNGQVTQWTIPFVAAFRTNHASVSLQYNGLNWEQSAFSSSSYQTTVRSTNAAQLTHGQVYFKWNGSASRFELCPLNGPGGLIVDGAMQAVPFDCLTLGQNETFSTNLNYFYAAHTPADILTVDSVSDNGSGNIRLGFSGTVPGNPGDKVAITCFSINGVIEANVSDAGQIHSTTEIDLLHTASPGPGPVPSTGTCELVRLAASLTGHATSDDGVESMAVTGGTDPHYTLVGIAYVDSSGAVNDSATKRDVASWFNRRAKTCINSYSADRTWTSTSTWGEPSTEIRCEFVAFDDAHESAKTWSIAGMFGNATPGDGTLVSAGFDPATMPAPETEVVGEKGNNISLGARGAKSSLTEGLHTISLLAKTIGGGTSTIFGVTPATSLEIQLWQ